MRALSFLLIILMAGCATVEKTSDINEITIEQGIVIGRVEFIQVFGKNEDGTDKSRNVDAGKSEFSIKKYTKYSDFSDPSMVLSYSGVSRIRPNSQGIFILSKESGKYFSVYMISNDWKSRGLLPNKYYRTEFSHAGASGLVEDLFGFVSQKNLITYVGTIRIIVNTNKSTLDPVNGFIDPISLEIVDDYEQNKSRIESIAGPHKDKIVKKLAYLIPYRDD